MKRILAVLLCICLLLSVTVLCCTAYDTDYDGYTVTVGDKTLPLEEYPIGSTCRVNSTSYPLPGGGYINVSGYECIGFARYVFYRCFGVVDLYDEGGSGYHNVVYNMHTTVTVDYLRSVLGVTALAGAHIRASNGVKGHSMVFLGCDDDYVYTYEANYFHDNGVTVFRRSWQELADFCNKKGGIHFIHMPDKYPGDPEITESPAFTDMPAENHWAYAGLQFMLENGLFAGTSETTISPDMEMSRAMLVTVLWRMEGAPETEDESPFSDVKAGDWFCPAVLWAQKAGIVSGIGDGKFGPNLTVTREQIAAILCSSVKRSIGDELQLPDAAQTLCAYPDGAKVSAWAQEGVTWAITSGCLSGSQIGGEVYLQPQAGATRAQVASIIMRFCSAEPAQETDE